MSNIVADVMTSFQSDFENFDRPYIENADSSKFPMIWIVGKSHTHLLNLGGCFMLYREATETEIDWHNNHQLK